MSLLEIDSCAYCDFVYFPILDIYSCWLPPQPHGTIFAFIGPMVAIIVVSWLNYYSDRSKVPVFTNFEAYGLDTMQL